MFSILGASTVCEQHAQTVEADGDGSKSIPLPDARAQQSRAASTSERAKLGRYGDRPLALVAYATVMGHFSLWRQYGALCRPCLPSIVCLTMPSFQTCTPPFHPPMAAIREGQCPACHCLSPTIYSITMVALWPHSLLMTAVVAVWGLHGRTMGGTSGVNRQAGRCAWAFYGMMG